MKFVNFPKKQNLYLISSSYEAFRSKLFHNLYIQASPKNSLFFRILRTKFGYYLISLFKQKLGVPKLGAEYVGIVKNDNPILFELENNKPIGVWRLINETQWKRSHFLGYQLISEYTLKEFDLKYEIIEKALVKQWNLINENPINVHGDFTHFNVLFNDKYEIVFIDKKSNIHSKLFDFYYFYAYLRQCLSKCITLQDKDVKIIVENINGLLRRTCQYDSQNELINDYKRMNIPDVTGLNRKESYMEEFYEIFIH